MQLNQSDPEYIEAMTYYLSGDWRSAEKSFTALAEKYPESPFIYLILGNTYYSMGRLDTAVEYYEKSVQIKPDFGIAYYKLGVCQYRIGRLQRALDSFQKVIDLKNQSHAMAIYFVGLINLLLGDDQGATDAFADFREASPGSGIAKFYLAQLKIKRHEWEDALELLNELVKETPHFAEVHYMLGVVHYGLHNNTDAIKCFRKALEINPDDQRSKTKLTLLTDIPWP